MEDLGNVPTATEIEGNLQEEGKGKKKKLRLRRGVQAVEDANKVIASGGLPNRPIQGMPVTLPGEGGGQNTPWMGMPTNLPFA